MKSIILTLLFVGCAFSAVVREKRQTTCQEPDIPNVCVMANGRIYFPHPTDNTKFLQCADGARMFIINCPKGEMYDKTQTKCVSMQTTNPGTTMNMCTAANIASGNLFFPYASDNTKFIECTAVGQPTVLSCPSRLVYNSGRQSCVLPTGTVVNGGTTGTGTNTGTSTGTGTGVVVGNGLKTNPCAGQTAATGANLFFPHPDPSKFIQCDLIGDAYVMQCPAGLVWSQSTSNCQGPFGTSGSALVG